MVNSRELENLARALTASRDTFQREQQKARAKMMDSSKPRRVPQPPLERRSKRDWEILEAMRNR